MPVCWRAICTRLRKSASENSNSRTVGTTAAKPASNATAVARESPGILSPLPTRIVHRARLPDEHRRSVNSGEPAPPILRLASIPAVANQPVHVVSERLQKTYKSRSNSRYRLFLSATEADFGAVSTSSASSFDKRFAKSINAIIAVSTVTRPARNSHRELRETRGTG